jgi:hypothetical protein
LKLKNSDELHEAGASSTQAHLVLATILIPLQKNLFKEFGHLEH